MIVGEASKLVPDDIKQQNPHISWKGITGMCDKLVHQYFGIKFDVIWDNIVNRIPQTRLMTEELLHKGDDADSH